LPDLAGTSRDGPWGLPDQAAAEGARQRERRLPDDAAGARVVGASGASSTCPSQLDRCAEARDRRQSSTAQSHRDRTSAASGRIPRTAFLLAAVVGQGSGERLAQRERRSEAILPIRSRAARPALILVSGRSRGRISTRGQDSHRPRGEIGGDLSPMSRRRRRRARRVWLGAYPVRPADLQIAAR